MASSAIKYEPMTMSEVPLSEQGMDYRSIYSYAPYNDLSFYDDPPNGRNRRDRKHGILNQASHSHTRKAEEDRDKFQTSIVETVMIFVSYMLVIASFPISLIFTVKFVETFERLVIFRLGRLQKCKGPGAVMVLPCIDHWKRVDLRSKAFNVPPIQAVTADGSVIELGASVFYRIKDAMAAVVSIQDWNVSTRNLAHTALHRHINKQYLSDIQKDKRKLANELLMELNEFTFSWGMEITEVDLSDVKVLKEGVNQTMNVLKQLLRPEVAGKMWQSLIQGDGIDQINPFIASGTDVLWQTVSEDGRPVSMISTDSETAPLVPSSPGNSSLMCQEHEVALDLERLVWTLSAVMDESLVKQVGHIYQIHCPGLGDFWIDLKNGSGTVQEGLCPPEMKHDVTLTIEQSDLMGIFMGALSPLDAYLSGRVQLEGKTGSAMKLKVLGEHIKAQFGTLDK